MGHRDFYGYTIYENGDIVNKYGKQMSPRNNKGRLEIKLTINGVRKNFSVGRLVYCVFNNIDPFTFDKDQCVTFKDGDKLNVNLDNLECKYRGDLIQGEKHNISKLTDKEIEEIRKKYFSTKNNRPINQYDVKGEYHSYRSLAKDYDVTYPTIKQIIEGDYLESVIREYPEDL